ncbi:MAG: NADPH-dependent glutamate synthase [Bacteroidales bacterium]|nr:NADPH-dependent glutamate synthase [Bacteroidales bacterium]MDD5814913.1 NADPH-dependent glutamate synthase [Bacteroidales bacterium]MDY4521536.1 NADPH-dependent glutamate synthase [Bacteroidales bacterium]
MSDIQDIRKAQRDEEWRKQVRDAIKPKDRMTIERVAMPEADATERAHSYIEVNMGLNQEQAMTEAKRCLDCPAPSCVTGCPVEINIPTFIKNIERGEFIEAARVIKETSTLPAVCGRVCPQEKQCESKCIYNKTGKKPVAIGYLERFAADYERTSGKAAAPEVEKANGIKVAVIGSGPAGLTCSGELAKKGYDVTVFEALHEIGGVLKYGIPEFRLPNDIVDFEINNLRKMGVKFEADFIVGKTATMDDLRAEGFKAFFVASGAGLPRFMNIPGENYNGIMSSNEYLTRVNLMHAADSSFDTPIIFGKNVAVIGGGNTAMDSVRTAKRLGADKVMLIYRRSEAEMPARLEEVHHAKEEGIEFHTLCNPVEYLADDKGRVCAMKVQRMELGEPDERGRRKPVPIPGAIDEVPVDLVVVSVGVSPNPLIPNSHPDIKTTDRGTLEATDALQTSVPDVFAGGDIVRGGATVILAMGDGRKAAASIDSYLKSL